MTSGMVVASSQRNLHIFRNPVMQVAGAGTPDDPEHCIIDENLATRAHGTRRVYCKRYQLERMTELPIYESDRNTWTRRPHFNLAPGSTERMTDAQASTMPVTNGRRSAEYTYHQDGGAPAIVFRAQMPQDMMEPMRGLNGTDQPEEYGTDDSHPNRFNPGALAPPDEHTVRPDWHGMLERATLLKDARGCMTSAGAS